MYVDTVQFDSIVILESLGPGERKTGTWLFDNVLQPWARANSPFTALLNSIGSKAQFLAALRAIDQQLLAKGRAPIIHIEAHGDKDSIQLSNGEHVTWDELRDQLTAINLRCGFNLLVVMAMCEGWWLSRLLLPLHPSPVWGIIGPTKPVWDTDLRNAMEAFYRVLLKTFDARQAMDEANQNKPYTDWEYLLETAEMMYCRVFNHYVKEPCTPEHLKERENEIVAEIFRRNGYRLEIAFEARDHAKQMLADHRRFFDFYRYNFFMLEALPQNADRFKLTFEDCTQAA
jgi:hypothetical protein